MPFARDIRFAPLGIAATGDVVAAIPGKRIVVIGYSIINSVATPQTITFRSTANAISGVIALPSAIGGGVVWDGGPDCPAFATVIGEPLNIQLGAATAVAGHVTYIL